MASVTHIIAPASRQQPTDHAARPQERSQTRPILLTRSERMLELARHGVRMRGPNASRRSVNRLPL